MQVTIDIPDKDEDVCEFKQVLLQQLANEKTIVISTALVYAKQHTKHKTVDN